MENNILGNLSMATKLITPGELAPDFEVEDVRGNRVRLSDYRGKKPVVLAFLRGFM
jgi:peroxiredoxin